MNDNADENKIPIEVEYFTNMLSPREDKALIKEYANTFAFTIALTLLKCKLHENGDANPDEALKLMLDSWEKGMREQFDGNIAMHRIMMESKLGGFMKAIVPDSQSLSEQVDISLQDFRDMVDKTWDAIKIDDISNNDDGYSFD